MVDLFLFAYILILGTYTYTCSNIIDQFIVNALCLTKETLGFFQQCFGEVIKPKKKLLTKPH